MEKPAPEETLWPPVAYEPRPWERDEAIVASRRALRAAAGDYLAAVPPSIATSEVRVSARTLALAADASTELAHFDAGAGAMAAPFASILLRTESASSSEVEHVTSSAKQVALAEIDESKSANARLVVSNVRAMNAAIALAGRLDEAAIIAMHEALLGETAPQFVGAWRDQQVWIGGSISPHTARFVPPHHERVPELMHDLVVFAQRTDIPALVQAAIAHAQFETIHPFPDGNGRTGRALLHGMLRAAHVTRHVAVPVSAGLLADTEPYFEALTRYRAGDADPIVEIVAEASFRAIDNSNRLVSDIRTVAERWRRDVRARADAAAHRLIDYVLQQPAVNTRAVAAALGISTVSAQHAIDTLVEAGALRPSTSARRNRIWQADEILSALDAFGNRARRRFG